MSTQPTAGAPEFHNARGQTLAAQGRLDEAIAAFQEALRLRRGYAEAHNNLGVALIRADRLDEAIDSFRQVVTLEPGYRDAYNSLSFVLHRQGRLDEAITVYRQAIAQWPGHPRAHYNFSILLQLAGNLDEAAANLRYSLSLDPGYAAAHNDLGNALLRMGAVEEAVGCYDRAIALQPASPIWHSNRIYALHFHPDCDGPLLLKELLEWDRRHARPLKPPVVDHSHSLSQRRLRIGYVSPDFREHVVGRNLLPLLRQHDHGQFEIFCYSDLARGDSVTERFRACADQWRGIAGASDEKVAQMIRSDRIDILLDLSLHMAGNRLLVFARKPAPVQVTFAGYPGGTGLEAMDYRLTDPYLDPPGESDADYRERSVRLPHSFWCYEGDADATVTPLPALAGGQVTFGCLNNFGKVNGGVLALWARVLREVSGSKLMLLTPRGSTRDRVRATMAKHDLDPVRIEFAEYVPHRQYLELYQRIDIALDTFPYNGHTTSLDGLWMGVPTVTLIGKTAVGRAGWSQLSNLGLEHLASRVQQGFIQTAANLAGDLAALAELRAGLRPRMLASPLMDARGFCRGIEEAYRGMWEERCNRTS
jgi:predicted O-linked N-acetylglucosamine transferase (SPINDLY family)